MTGWRLGWLVVPDALVPVIERLAQNLFICASTVSQYAALACFEPESLAIYEERRAAFKQRRDHVIPQLQAMGLPVPVMPDGAFYAWADCRSACDKLGLADSWAFAEHVMREAHVAITPGKDFGVHAPADFVRFSTASSMEQLHTAMERLRAMLAG
jgi:aspartate/methionine/tyrosine aminotransferase